MLSWGDVLLLNEIGGGVNPSGGGPSASAKGEALEGDATKSAGVADASWGDGGCDKEPEGEEDIYDGLDDEDGEEEEEQPDDDGGRDEIVPHQSSELTDPAPLADATATAIMRCSMCLLGSSDHDLADFEGQRRVSFLSVKAGSTASEIVCDSCENFMRFHMMTRSKADMHRRLATPNTGTATLHSLSWSLALRSTGMERISKQRVDFRKMLVKRQDIIFKRLLELRQFPLPGGEGNANIDPGSEMTTDNRRVIPLMEYIRSFGNPLINQHAVTPMMADDVVGLGVLVPTAGMDDGRYELSAAVSEAWGVAAPPPPPSIRALKAAKVDDLRMLTVVKDIVVEYSIRQRLLAEAGASHAPRPASSTGSGQGTDNALRSSAGSASVGDMEVPSPPQHRYKPGAGGALTMSSASATSPPKPLPMQTPPAKRKRCDVEVASSSASQSASLAVAVAPRFVGRSPASGIDRDFMKMKVRCVTFLASIFGVVPWATLSLRGKEKKASNVVGAIDTFVASCRKSEREDLLDELMRWRDIMEASQTLIGLGVGKKGPKCASWDPRQTHDKIEKVHRFFDEMAQDFQHEGGGKIELAFELQITEVVLGVRGRGMGSHIVTSVSGVRFRQWWAHTRVTLHVPLMLIWHVGMCMCWGA